MSGRGNAALLQQQCVWHVARCTGELVEAAQTPGSDRPQNVITVVMNNVRTAHKRSPGTTRAPLLCLLECY